MHRPTVRTVASIAIVNPSPTFVGQRVGVVEVGTVLNKIQRWPLLASRRLLLLAVISSCSYFGIRKVIAADNSQYTIVMNEVTFNRDGKPILSESVTYARRSDGSEVKMRSILKPDKSGYAIQRKIFNLVTGEETLVDGVTNSTTTMPMPAKALETARLSRVCTNDLNPERDQISGIDVVKVVTNIKHSTTMKIEQWQAPTLNCFSLSETAYTTDPGGDSFRKMKTSQASKVDLGEPNPSMFEIPTSYQERRPSDLRGEYFRLYPNEPKAACLRTTDQKLDELYASRRAVR